MNTTETSAPERGGEGPPMVLLVDDDDAIRESLGEVLEEEGYAVLKAQNGREAIRLLKERRCGFCLMLLDLMMPVMNGWQLLEALKQCGELERCHVVILTAARQGAAMPEGASGFLAKPLPLDVLLQTVKLHCGSPSDARA